MPLTFTMATDEETGAAVPSDPSHPTVLEYAACPAQCLSGIGLVTAFDVHVPDADDLQTSSSVTAHYGKILEKVNTGYDPLTQEFTWEIRYNYGEKTIP